MISQSDPLILERTQHNISRRDIDPEALKVLYRLIKHGYKAYLVGGGVRDLLLGKQPKDFDIATDARPEHIRSIFRNSRVIGRRFKIIHVFFHGNKIIEVATFRALADPADELPDEGPVLSDNTYGDPQSDAFRRDLTINGLFYDISTFSVIDYVGGIDDLRNGIVRIIGEPVRRIKEDPVRMLRAVRHAAKAGFVIEPKTHDAIRECAALITSASLARVHEELARELRSRHALDSFRLMRSTGVIHYVLPTIPPLAEDGSVDDLRWDALEQRLARFDNFGEAIAQVPEAVLWGAVYWERLENSQPIDDDDDPLETEDQDIRREELHLRLKRVLSRPVDAPLGGRRRRKQRKEVTGGTNVVNELLVPLGVSRKEREDLTSILEIAALERAGARREDLPSGLRRHPLLERAGLLEFFISGEGRTTVSPVEQQPQRRRSRRRGGRRRSGRHVRLPNARGGNGGDQ